MAGVRITHPTARNARFTIVESDKPYNPPYQCAMPSWGGCGALHLFKTHHLDLDETGSVILGDTLYLRLRPILLANGFAESNAVAKPPTLSLFMGARLMRADDPAGPYGDIPIIRGIETPR